MITLSSGNTEDGGLIPAVCDGVGGRYHVQWESILIPKELQYSTFNQSKPILDAAMSQQKILVSPLPRYLNNGCCAETEHVVNLKEEDYKSKLDEVVVACRCNLKDFLF